ncbi:angiogenic factor with G patch and FHA domains 1 isoform X2 [Ochlerotatus camptorhynchus]|uniref:angiogenic factor with G patch and FHA domains 1 isoform X2 n=1 Tax=Ochlerotatus camptorhynchus TaxID=644619 RepID=UPI0031DE97E2
MTKPPSKMKTKLIRVTNLCDVTVKQFYAYVRNLHRHIRIQNAKIRRLRRKIVDLRKRRRQKPNVKEVEELEEDDGEDFMKALERAEAQQAQAASEPLNVKAFVDDIKKTAQEFDYQNRYIYEPTSGLYYDPETGYYYNAIYGLHYDGQRGCYLKYNEQTQKYDFYSQVIPEESLEKEKPKTFQKVFTPSTQTHSINSLVSAFSGLEIGRMRSNALDISRKYPPSLRLIVQESNVATVKQGSLFIITCKGGSLGREGDHDVIIPDINVSKYHLKFTYHGQRATYQLLDLGSRNGTLLNGTRMAPTMQESDTFDIVHGDVIELNRTKLLCHIHDGSFTCGNCEPGLLMKSTGDGEPPEDDRITKPVSHKEGLKLLQRRYGLEEEKYVEPTGSGTVDYNDRAAHRRKVKGSSNEHAKTQAASVNQQISSENKGFKMLSKLGWSEGQSLGKNDQGLKEPIPMTTNVGTSGLGSRTLVEPTTGPDDAKKLIWQMTQERYKACADVEGDAGVKMASAKVASLDQQISSENKGFQMLAKLGWNKGQSLGKEGGDGLKEPISLLSNVGTSGLGSKPLKKPGTNAAASGKKKTIWKKKQSKCSATKLFAASDSE